MLRSQKISSQQLYRIRRVILDYTANSQRIKLRKNVKWRQCKMKVFNSCPLIHTKVKTYISCFTAGPRHSELPEGVDVRVTNPPPGFPDQMSPECIAAMLTVKTQCGDPTALFGTLGVTSEREILNKLSQMDMRELCRYAITDGKRHNWCALSIDSRSSWILESHTLSNVYHKLVCGACNVVRTLGWVR